MQEILEKLSDIYTIVHYILLLTLVRYHQLIPIGVILSMTNEDCSNPIRQFVQAIVNRLCSG